MKRTGDKKHQTFIIISFDSSAVAIKRQQNIFHETALFSILFDIYNKMDTIGIVIIRTKIEDNIVFLKNEKRIGEIGWAIYGMFFQ